MYTLESRTEEQLIERFFKYVEKPPENSRVFEITPQLAELILDPDGDHNNLNRRKKAGKVEEYSVPMAAGEWGLTGATLKMSLGKQLLDGQHRLRSCLRTGRPFITHAVFGIDDDMFHLIDQGAKKSPADIFKMAGITNSREMAGALQWLAVLEGPDPKRDRKARTPAVLLEMHRERGTRLQAGVSSAKAISRKYDGMRPATLLLAIWYLADQKDPAKAALFMDLFASGDQVRGKAMMTAKDLIQHHREVANKRIHDRVRAAILINSWNEFVNGRKGSRKSLDYNILMSSFPSVQAKNGGAS